MQIHFSPLLHYNSNLLWNNADSDLWVDCTGQLGVISKWNLLGKIKKYVLDYNGAITQKIHITVQRLFNEIRNFNQYHALYPLYVFDIEQSNNRVYPAPYLANRIKFSRQFNSDEALVALADDIIQQYFLYPDSQYFSLDHPKILNSRENFLIRLFTQEEL